MAPNEWSSFNKATEASQDSVERQELLMDLFLAYVHSNLVTVELTSVSSRINWTIWVYCWILRWKEREKTDNNPLYWSFYESHNYGTTLLLYPGKRGSVTHQYMDWVPVVAFSKCWLPDLINLILYKFYARCKAGSLAKHWKIIHPDANLKMYSGVNPHSVAYIYAWLQWPWIIWALHAVIIDVNMLYW